MDLLLILACSLLLGLGQADELLAQAPGVPIVNAGAEDAKAISAKIEALKQTKTFLTIDEARKQLERTACDIQFAQPTKSVRLGARFEWFLDTRPVWQRRGDRVGHRGAVRAGHKTAAAADPSSGPRCRPASTCQASGNGQRIRNAAALPRQRRVWMTIRAAGQSPVWIDPWPF